MFCIWEVKALEDRLKEYYFKKIELVHNTSRRTVKKAFKKCMKRGDGGGGPLSYPLSDPKFAPVSYSFGNLV